MSRKLCIHFKLIKHWSTCVIYSLYIPIANIYSETWELGTPKGTAKNCPEFKGGLIS